MFEEIHFEKMYIIIGSICGYELNNVYSERCIFW